MNIILKITINIFECNKHSKGFFNVKIDELNLLTN